MKHGNILLIILAMVGIVAASVGGYFWWSSFAKAPADKQELTWEDCIKISGARMLLTYPGICVSPDGRKVTQTLSEEEKKKLQPPDETANWKTYIHPTLNYSFSYPENLQVKNFGSKVLVQIDPPDPRLIVDICTRYVSFSVADSKSKPTVRSNEYSCVSETSVKEGRIFVESQYRKNDNKLIDQILSTFKFIDQSSEGSFCGGIAGVLCPTGYECRLDGNYPDAGGKCVTDSKKFTCPVNGWLNCMPILTPEAQNECNNVEWFKKNCSNFQGVAY